MLDILTDAFADEMQKLAAQASDKQVREKMSKLSPEAREHARRLLVRDRKSNPDAARRLKILNDASRPGLSSSTNEAMGRARLSADRSAYADKGWRGLTAQGRREQEAPVTSIAMALPNRDAKLTSPSTWFKTHRASYQPARKWAPQTSTENVLGRWSRGRTSGHLAPLKTMPASGGIAKSKSKAWIGDTT